MMKRKILFAGLLVTMAVSMSGCGKADGENADSLDDINPDEYVTLGDYKNLEINVDHYEVKDDEVKQYVAKDLDNYVDNYDLYDYTTTDKQTVSTNDIVNIDYEGKKDGVAFSGGTAQGAHLEIGSGRFIDGFEDGLLGANVGDTVELNLTFPEDYGNDELNGQEVVFTVSINSIDESHLPDYDEAFFANLGIDNVTNYDEYLDYAKEYIQNACDQQNNTAIETALWDVVKNGSEVSDVPQSLLDEKLAELDDDLQEYADQYGVDTDTMIGYMGYDADSYEEMRQSTARSEAEKDLICRAIAKAEGITITEDDVKEVAQEEYESYGFTSAADMISSKSDEYLRSYVRYRKIMDLLKETANVTENESISFLADYLE
ncbi:MAG: trigger factor [Lachnospiraceae bacterium]|nr:trigger factor [Lachnospiraceae bacterium]MDD5853363.1 trigger factor [Lachnospiraceae bacterium]